MNNIAFGVSHFGQMQPVVVVVRVGVAPNS